jgi:hypothetical protein
MRFETEFDFHLKIRDAQGLPEDPKVGTRYEFTKTIARVYPIGIPILLTDDDLNVIGKCVIHEFRMEPDMTSGVYEVLEVYGTEKRRIFTEDLADSVRWMKGRGEKRG